MNAYGATRLKLAAAGASTHKKPSGGPTAQAGGRSRSKESKRIDYTIDAAISHDGLFKRNLEFILLKLRTNGVTYFLHHMHLLLILFTRG